MRDYGHRASQEIPDGTYYFTPVRQGTIGALLCAGSLLGSLIAGDVANRFGRRMTISSSALFCCIGIVIEISSNRSWAQFATGRLVNGRGIGSLSGGSANAPV